MTAPAPEQAPTVPDVVPTISGTTDQASLTDALAFVCEIIAKSPKAPIMRGVLIEGCGGWLTVTGHDFKTTVTQRVPGKGSGQVLVPGRTVRDLVKGLAKGCEITLGVDGGKLTITGDGVTYGVPTLPLDKYPTPPIGPVWRSETVAVMPGKDLANVEAVRGAASRDTTLPVLCSVQFTAECGAFLIVSTDKYRLYEWATDAGVGGHEIDGAGVVGSDVVRVVCKYMAKSDRVEFGFSPDGGVVISDGERTVVTAGVDGDYPNLRRLWPSEQTSRVTVAKDLILKVVGQVAKAVDRNCPVRLAASGGSLVVSTGSAMALSATASVPAETGAETEEFGAAFNPGFLTDAVKAASGATIAMTGRATPAVITGARKGFRALLMPVRLPG